MGWFLFFAAPVHIAATGWLYRFPDVRREAGRHSARYVWVPLGLIAGCALAAALMSPGKFRWLLIAFFAWQFWHFHKQNVGMLSLGAVITGTPTPTSVERRVLTVAAVSAIVMICAHPGLLQIGVRRQLGAVTPAAIGVFACSAVAGLLVVRRRSSRAYRLCFAVALLFWLPVFLFRSPVAALGGLTLAHGYQYLLLVGAVTAGDTQEPGWQWNLLALGAVGLAGGAALSTVSHLHSDGPGLRVLYGAWVGVLMSHFVIDARLWRLRDAFPQQFLGTRLPVVARRLPGRISLIPADLG